MGVLLSYFNILHPRLARHRGSSLGRWLRGSAALPVACSLLPSPWYGFAFLGAS